MRRNLTISLSMEDWRTVRELARSLGETYSSVIHHLIRFGSPREVRRDRVEKYRALLAPHAEFFEERARVFARAAFRRPPQE